MPKRRKGVSKAVKKPQQSAKKTPTSLGLLHVHPQKKPTAKVIANRKKQIKEGKAAKTKLKKLEKKVETRYVNVGKKATIKEAKSFWHLTNKVERGERRATLNKKGALNLGLYSPTTNGRPYMKRIDDDHDSRGYSYVKTGKTIAQTIEDRYVDTGMTIDDWLENYEEYGFDNEDDALIAWYH